MSPWKDFTTRWRAALVPTGKLVSGSLERQCKNSWQHCTLTNTGSTLNCVVWNVLCFANNNEYCSWDSKMHSCCPEDSMLFGITTSSCRCCLWQHCNDKLFICNPIPCGAVGRYLSSPSSSVATISQLSSAPSTPVLSYHKRVLFSSSCV